MFGLRMFRRSPFLVGLPGAVILAVVLLLGRDTSWLGVWPRGSAMAQQCSFYLAAFVAALQAMVAGRRRRAGMSSVHYPAAVSPLRLSALEVGLGLGFVALTYPVPFVLVAVLNRMHGSPPGGIWWSYVLLGVPVMLLGLALGHVCGCLIPSDYLAPIAAAAASFVLLATIGQRIHIVAMDGDAWLDVAPAAVASRCVVGVSAVLIAWTAPALPFAHAGRTHAGWRPPLTPSVLAVSGALALLLAGVVAVGKTPDVQVARRAPAHPVCVGASPRVCVWPDDTAYLADVRRMQQGMANLPGSFAVPEFFEPGLTRPAGAAELSTAGGRMWSASNAAAVTIGLKTYPSTCVPDGAQAQQRFTTANFNILGFLVKSIYGTGNHGGESGGPPVDAHEIDTIVAADEAQQTRWLKAQEKDLHAPPCTRG